MYELPRKGRNENKGRSGGTQESLDKKRGGEPAAYEVYGADFLAGSATASLAAGWVLTAAPPSPLRNRLTDTCWAVGVHSRSRVPRRLYSAPMGPV